MIKEERKKRDAGVSKLDSMQINTIIGNDIIFKGDLNGDSVIRIDGKVEGNISSKQGIILGEKAFVEGNMESDYIILFGHIKGNIKSKEIILKSTGTVQGDIVTDALEIEMGSRYDGNLKISQIEEVKDIASEYKKSAILPLIENRVNEKV
jgi:cytoskeletal protein CcmA (bactofilin family)